MIKIEKDLLLEDIKNRLEFFGYTLLDSDSLALDFVIDKVENSIKNICSITEIPDGLYQVEIDRICGEFLFAKKQSGQLTEYDFEASIKEIKDLDTTVVYAVGSDSSEKQFDLLIDGLRNCGEGEILSFRRLRW
ncbi:hypothetical protein [Metaclostridioides mangenotii]|uniref:Uncharacterized protein n=1 Tax=Metaclostridioides mangenotii TaxID=1540 RepID=A0ABS4E9Q1_9FIRM|nr:hypothetical protein [Clostridioides mangenotii]MBP1854657.1 hypothetical protein [Clostridioides mangenotii]